MNFKIPVTGLLIGLLAACSDNKYSTTAPLELKPKDTVQSQPQAELSLKAGIPKVTTPFDRASFPQQKCGDKLPNNLKNDKVKLYPVFIDYNERNLQYVKAQYCGDAFKISRKKQDEKEKNKYYIQVASFTSEERANQFKDFLKQKLNRERVEVGQPSEISVKSTSVLKKEISETNDSNNISGSYDSVGKTAKLTHIQIKKLIEIESRKGYKTSDFKEAKTKVVLPTYLPPGFNLSYFATDYSDMFGGRYQVVYCNSSNSCFLLEGGISRPIGDEPLIYKMIKEIYSPALGKVELGSTNYDRTRNQPYIGFTGSMNRFRKDDDDNDYVFQSGAGLAYSLYESPKNIFDTNAVSFEEAVKIVESLQYLNP